MKANRITSCVVVALALLLLLGQSFGGAKAAPPAAPAAHFQASSIAAQVSPPAKQGAGKVKTARPTTQSPLDITVQGRLTDPSGNPITVATAVVLAVYNVPSGGSALISQNATITPDQNGLFTSQLTVPSNDANGDYDSVSNFAGKLYLGITVGSDAEMTPRFEMTAAPYAMSLAPGAVISGNFDFNVNSADALVNVINTNTTNQNSRGLEADGPIGLFGHGTLGGGVSNGVVGISLDGNVGVGGVFTGTVGVAGLGTGGPSSAGTGVKGTSGGGNYSEGVSGYSNGGSAYYVKGVSARGIGTNAFGIYGSADGTNSVGVYGTVDTGNSSDIGVYAEDYNHQNTAVGLQVKGKGQATGGFVTGGPYSIMVRYDGSEELHPGDVLALDGNNQTLDDAIIFGTTKARAADSAIGVAQHRYIIFDVAAMPAHGFQPGEAAHHQPQVDDQAVTFKPGDFIEVVVIGQAQMKVAGTVKVGDHLGLDQSGNVAVAKPGNASVGQVASAPDKDGNVLIFVNFK